MPDLKSKWMFTDARSEGRNPHTEYRIQVRAVSGRRVPTNGLPVVSERAPDGTQLISLTGLSELQSCIHAWGCPVTISPPEGELPWMLELEDGPHA